MKHNVLSIFIFLFFSIFGMQEGLAQNPNPPTGLQVELNLPLRTLTVTATGAGKGTIVKIGRAHV